MYTYIFTNLTRLQNLYENSIVCVKHVIWATKIVLLNLAIYLEICKVVSHIWFELLPL